MKPPADIIRQLLIDLGLGAAVGDWTTYVSFLPSDPEKALCVYDTVGRIDGRLMQTGEQIEHPGIQIRVRGADYVTTWEKAKAIALALDAVNQNLVSISSDETYTINNVSRSGPVIPLGMEVEGTARHYHFTINAVLTITNES